MRLHTLSFAMAAALLTAGSVSAVYASPRLVPAVATETTTVSHTVPAPEPALRRCVGPTPAAMAAHRAFSVAENEAALSNAMIENALSHEARLMTALTAPPPWPGLGLSTPGPVLANALAWSGFTPMGVPTPLAGLDQAIQLVRVAALPPMSAPVIARSYTYATGSQVPAMSGFTLSVVSVDRNGHTLLRGEGQVVRPNGQIIRVNIVGPHGMAVVPGHTQVVPFANHPVERTARASANPNVLYASDQIRQTAED